MATNRASIFPLLVLLLSLVAFASAADSMTSMNHTMMNHTMPMNTTSTANSTMDMGGHSMGGMAPMKMYFHFTKGDPLLFKTWAPNSEGPFGGACVFLCVLAIIDRALHAVRAAFEVKWSFESRALASLDTDSITKQDEAAPAPVAPRVLDIFRGGSAAAWVQPQKITRDALRAVLQGLHSGLGLILMLSVMNYNAWFFFSVVLGLAAGEFIFGRFSASHSRHNLSQGGHC